MQKRRAGFTMIELVFVIVILGVLASVAIPKLAATRDDAEVAAGQQRLSSMVSDIGSYYTSHGFFDSNVSKMTNELLVDSSNVKFVGNFKTASAYFGNIAKTKLCIKVIADDNNGTLKLVSNSDGSGYCKSLISQSSAMLKTHQFGGAVIYDNN